LGYSLFHVFCVVGTKGTDQVNVQRYVTVAAVGGMDLYRRHVPKRVGEEARLLSMGRLITLLTGALAGLTAVGVSTMQSTVIQTVHSLASTCVGPITGMFFLGVLTSGVQVQRMLVGAFLGLITSVTAAWTPVGRDSN